MASINDVNSSVLKVRSAVSNLNDTVQNEIIATNNVTTSVNTVNASVNALDSDVKSGFAATVNGLQVLAQIGEAAVKLLFHLTQQADTMICELGQISKNTCGILTQAMIQTQLQKRLARDAHAIREIEESAHPESVLELHRLADLRAQIEACCPPAQPEPACTYAPCLTPTPVDMPDLPKIPGRTGTTGNVAG